MGATNPAVKGRNDVSVFTESSGLRFLSVTRSAFVA